MGTSIASGILNPKDRSISVKHLIATVLTEQSKGRLEKALTMHSSRVTVLLQSNTLRAIQEADVVLICVKPFQRAQVLGANGVREALPGKLLLSILAGTPVINLHNEIYGQDDGTPSQIIRAMPNMAATIREAVTLITGNMETLTNHNLLLGKWVFSQVGDCTVVAESTFEISAVLVGCAGSLLMLALDGLLDAAVAEGINRTEAREMAANSAVGMMKLIPSGEHPSVLREKIASPGGCSIRALLELERRAVRSAYCDALLAAAERSRVLAKM
jgi:pyrroline-5-carboxylate reductase